MASVGERRLGLGDALLRRLGLGLLGAEIGERSLHLGLAGVAALREPRHPAEVLLQPVDEDALGGELRRGAGAQRLLLLHLGGVAARLDAGDELPLHHPVALLHRELEEVARRCWRTP